MQGGFSKLRARETGRLRDVQRVLKSLMLFGSWCWEVSGPEECPVDEYLYHDCFKYFFCMNVVHPCCFEPGLWPPASSKISSTSQSLNSF